MPPCSIIPLCTRVLLSLLALYLHLSLVTRSIDGFQILLADQLFPGHFTLGVVDFSQFPEGGLEASLGRNLPVTDCDFIVAKVIVFGPADIVVGHSAPSQRAYSLKQNDPCLIDGYSVALGVANPNLNASLRRTEFDGTDPTIKSFEVVFGYTRPRSFTPLVSFTHQC